MKKRKRIITALAAVILLLSLIIVPGVFAYLTGTEEESTDVSFENTPTCELVSSGGSYSVKNTGNVSCYVRVFAHAAESTSESGSESVYSAGSGWTLNSDGYYYYGSVLAAGSTTTAAVSVGSDDAIVYAEVVQAEGYNSASAAFAAAD